MSIRKRQLQRANIEDFKDDDGKWKSHKVVYEDGVKIHCKTRSACIWDRVTYRVKESVGSSCQIQNGFNDYQMLADWCQTEYGYLEKEPDQNKYWSIDKDILSSRDIKIYSPETCIFVSNRYNGIIKNYSSYKGEWPKGVAKKRENSWIASFWKNNKTNSKTFHCPYEAHFYWVQEKINTINFCLESDEEIKHHARLRKGLNNWLEIFQYHLENKIEFID